MHMFEATILLQLEGMENQLKQDQYYYFLDRDKSGGISNLDLTDLEPHLGTSVYIRHRAAYMHTYIYIVEQNSTSLQLQAFSRAGACMHTRRVNALSSPVASTIVYARGLTQVTRNDAHWLRTWQAQRWRNTPLAAHYHPFLCTHVAIRRTLYTPACCIVPRTSKNPKVKEARLMAADA